MKIRIQGQPEFLLPLTVLQVELIRKVSEKHYDHVCRDASIEGYIDDNRNFLTSWRNILSNYVKYPPTEEDIASGFVVSVSATFRQLDTCCKILESFNLFALGNPLDRIEAGQLYNDLRAAMREANYLSAGWAATLDTSK
jgi:hypothetical protein